MPTQNIPNWWKKVKLGEVVEILDSQRIPLSSLEREKRKWKYPYYWASGIIDYIDDYIFDGEYLLISEDWANLVERKTPIAFVAKWKFWVNNHAHIIKGKDGLSDLYYLLYLFQILDISWYITWTAQPKLSQKNLQNIELLLPPLPVQRKVASILSAYDDLIENNNKRIKLLESMAKAIFDDMMKQAEEKGELEEVKVSDLWKVITWKTPSKKEKDNFWDYIPFVKIPDLHWKVYITSYEEWLSKKWLEKLKWKIIPENSLVVSCIWTVWLVAINYQKIVTNQQINSVVFENQNYLYWLYFYLKKNKKELELLWWNGATMLNVNKEKFSSFKIKLPPQQTLQNFNNQVKPILDLILNLQLQNQNLKQTRDLLIPRLVSGKLDVEEMEVI